MYLRSLLEELTMLEPSWRFDAFTTRPLLPDALPANVREVVAERRGLSGLTARWGTMWLQSGLAREVRRRDLDLFWGPLQVLPLPLLGELPTIVSLHDLVFKRYPETMSRRNRLALARVVGPSVRGADRVFVLTEATGRAAVNELGLDPARVRLVPGGVDERRTTPAAGEAEKRVGDLLRARGMRSEAIQRTLGRGYLLFVGTVEPRKNLAGLLRAVRELILADRFDGSVVLAGPLGWGSGEISALQESEPLSGRVHRLGYVSNDDLAALYRGARMFVLPSLYEGFGLPVVEAMWHGTPVITSDREPFPEVLGDAGRMVSLEEPGGLGNAIASLWGDAAACADLSRRGLERARSYTWSKSAQKAAAAMAELTSR